ncbi:MAG: FAD-binding oxidoreductase [Chloroflexia bacterium]|nr:FAD-binding oxidoreductase [Chloroflexia bacterium]
MPTPVNDTTNARELAAGVHVDEIVTVESGPQLADVLREATVNNHSVIPFGGRRSLATGNPAGPAKFGLDLTGLSGILSYEPADLTLSVRAGTTLAEIQKTLGESGQELPIDVPFPEVTTVGGLAATGFAGPRRLRSGSLRDLLIGCEFVRGDGLLAKAGGMVVKNVSGFEIPRFLHGSWGALAVLISVNLKVTPLARADGTLHARFDGLDTAIQAVHRLIAEEPSIEACVVTSDPHGVLVAARAVGRPGAVAASLDSFAQRLGSEIARLEAEQSRAFWQDLVNRHAEDDSKIVLAIGARPRDVGSLATRIGDITAGHDATIQVSTGLGSLRIVIPANGEDLATGIAALATADGASYVLESASPALRLSLPTWGTEPEGIEVMRSVKREFDPGGILNPGRLPL